MNSFPLALRLSLRELRNGFAGFRLFLACLILGVTVIATISSLSRLMNDALQRDAKTLLGGDIEISLSGRELSKTELAPLSSAGTLSVSSEMRAMASNGASALLVELKAVDPKYPLYGDVTLNPPISLNEALSGNNIAIEHDVLLRLGLKLNDTITIGNHAFLIRAIIEREPDRVISGFSLGPRVLMRAENVNKTGLVVPGSLIQYRYKLALPPSLTAEALQKTLTTTFPESGWRIRTYKDANSTLKNFLSKLTVFMTLTGLTSLLCAGIGMAESVSAYMQRKQHVIAILKSLGASQPLVFLVYAIQLLLISLVGITAGMVMGGILPLAAAKIVQSTLQLNVVPTIYPASLLMAGSFGLLIVFTFSLWNLGKSMVIPPSILFRGAVPFTMLPPRKIQIANLILGIILAALIILTSSYMRLAIYFILGAVATLAVFSLSAKALKRLLAKFHPQTPIIRLGLTNLHRPGASTIPVIIAMGLGLTVLVTLLLVERNFQQQLATTIPKNAPTYFFMDIQKDQLDGFLTSLQKTDGVSNIETVPMVRGRITHINRASADESKIPEEARWALRSDRGLTYAAKQPKSSDIVAGTWWPENYQGKPLISFDAKLADEMGLDIGDTITFNILGQPIEATIANLRNIDYRTMQINFATIFSPGVLEGAPQTYLATARAASESTEQAILQRIIKDFPNITAINVKEALKTFENTLEKVAIAVQVVGIITLLSAILVLASTLAATEEKRIYNTVMFKVLGATRKTILTMLLIEFTILGIAAAGIALLIGTAAAYGVSRLLGLANISIFADVVLIATLGSLIVISVIGLLGNMRAFSARPISMLRNE